MADPFLKFYTSDWRSDPRLRMCSGAARGLWVEMICLMHEATPYGHLLVHGQPPNEAQLASLTGLPQAEVAESLSELARVGVFSTTKEGVIYSRKLVRMAAKARKAQRNGRKGGNPTLCKKEENPMSVNPPDKDRDKPQKPEARSQIEERDTDVSLVRSEIEQGIAAYNAMCEATGWPKVLALSKPRKAALSARLRDLKPEGWQALLVRASQAPHLCGDNDRGWRASFDWLTKPTNAAKVLEGNYDPKAPPRPDSKSERWDRMGRAKP